MIKRCKIHIHAANFEAEAAIIDNLVLIPTPHWLSLKPTKTIDDKHYYPLYFANVCPNNYGEYVPFSFECGGIEKWGYCSVSSGNIILSAQWDWAGDFRRCFAIVKNMGYYGVVDCYGEVWLTPNCDSNDFISCIDIKQANNGEDDIFFVKNEVRGKWGVHDMRFSGYDSNYADVGYNWDDIYWDGWGGFTVVENSEDGQSLYGIVNAGNEIIIKGLTQKPLYYKSPAWDNRQNSYRDGQYGSISFRIISKNGKYGLVRDEHDITNGSRLLHEPVHSYEYITKAADKEDMEWEISYYARLVWKSPKFTEDAWQSVPQDIKEEVRKYMLTHIL